MFWKICIFIFLLKICFIFKVQGSASCSKMQVLETGGLNCEEIMEILNVHNEIRQTIAKGLVKNQPKASNMRQMYWDEELANDAQKWANKCTFEHNNIKEREVARFKVGQNIAQIKTKRNSSVAKEFGKQINKWFAEHKNFNFGPIEKKIALQNTGHYTQIAWANSYMIGCGYSRFRNQKGLIHKLYVCHYGPTGNEVNETPYKIGVKKCPKNFVSSKQYPKLCSLKKSPSNVCEKKRLDKSSSKKLKNLSANRRFLQTTSSDSTEVDENKSEKSNSNINGGLITYIIILQSTIDKLIMQNL